VKRFVAALTVTCSTGAEPAVRSPCPTPPSPLSNECTRKTLIQSGRSFGGRSASPFACWCSGPARRSGPTTRKGFRRWVAARVLWFWTICARACSPQASTIPRSTRCTRDVLQHYGAVPLPCASGMRIEREGGVRRRPRPEDASRPD